MLSVSNFFVLSSILFLIANVACLIFLNSSNAYVLASSLLQLIVAIGTGVMFPLEACLDPCLWFFKYRNKKVCNIIRIFHFQFSVLTKEFVILYWHESLTYCSWSCYGVFFRFCCRTWRVMVCSHIVSCHQKGGYVIACFPIPRAHLIKKSGKWLENI